MSFPGFWSVPVLGFSEVSVPVILLSVDLCKDLDVRVAVPPESGCRRCTVFVLPVDDPDVVADDPDVVADNPVLLLSVLLVGVSR